MNKLQSTFKELENLYGEIYSRAQNEDEVWTSYCRLVGREDRTESEDEFVDNVQKEINFANLLLDQFFALEAQAKYGHELGGRGYLEKQVNKWKEYLETDQEGSDKSLIEADQQGFDTFTESLRLFDEDLDKWCDSLLEQYRLFKKMQKTSDALVQQIPPFKSEDAEKEI